MALYIDLHVVENVQVGEKKGGCDLSEEGSSILHIIVGINEIVPNDSAATVKSRCAIIRLNMIDFVCSLKLKVYRGTIIPR